MNRRDSGHASVLVLIVATALCASLAMALVGFGGHLIDRTRAQTAADAAALAALTGGSGAAHTLAQRHGATLVEFTRGPGVREVTVVVRLGDAVATAAASDQP
jgi:hypothetical protein